MSGPRDVHGLDTMLVVAIQFVVAVSVWGLLGLLVDLVAGTRPWVQFAGLALGTVIALALAQRHATQPPTRAAADD